MKETKFKDSLVGVIPQDWNVVKLSENGHLQKSTAQLLPDEKYVEYGMPAFDNGKKAEVKTGKEMQSGRFRISAPILLFNKLNVRQRRIWYLDKVESNAVCSMEFLPYVSDSIHLPYLRFVLDTEKVTSDFIGMSKGSSNSQKRISPNDFTDYSIALPPTIEEQQRISTALSDIDSLVCSLDAMIAKKQAIKQGAMQQLLTGKKRLKGFSGEWCEKKLEEIADINPKSSQKLPNEFYYIDLESVISGQLLNKQIVYSNNAPSRAQRHFQHNDILYQTVRPYQKNNLFVDFDGSKYIASTGYAIIRFIKDISDAKFIYYLLHTDDFVNRVMDNCTGTSYPAINPNILATFLFLIPPTLDEQCAISKILSDMDAEIKALQEKRNKYAAIKEGMMQQLLTGKIRLI